MSGHPGGVPDDAEQRRLGRLVQAGLRAADQPDEDPDAVRSGSRARDELAERNDPLAVSEARRFWERLGGVVPLEDLQQEARLGLLRAIQSFDPERPTRFSTYAVHWIRQAMRKYVYDNAGTIRVSVHATRKLQTARASGGHDSVTLAAQRARQVQHLDAQDADGVDGYARLQAPDDEQGQDWLACLEPGAFLETVLSVLDPVEQEVFSLRVGGSDGQMTQLECAAHLGLSVSEIQAIEVRLFNKLHSQLQAGLLRQQAAER